MLEFRLNDVKVSVDVERDMPLLWVIRDVVGQTGTKFGCGIGQCGACTVQLNGRAVRACITPVSQAQGKRVMTIEGLNDALGKKLQTAWRELDVAQCGYCQSGQIMAAHAAIRRNPRATAATIAQATDGNLCRCGSYQRIREAIRRVVNEA